jgi:MurNAc alpha-1-phosphate uridylyltransferase
MDPAAFPDAYPHPVAPENLCAVVLAAGAGTRLVPLTDLRPKALCPVGDRSLLDRALDRLTALGISGPDRVAVNAHHHAGQVAAAVRDHAHLSVEQPEALGTAGALGALRPWIADRNVLVCNADAYLAGGTLGPLLGGWSGERPRLLVVKDPARGDFGDWRFAGISLLPAAIAARLEPTPSGLYEVVWRDAEERSEQRLLRRLRHPERLPGGEPPRIGRGERGRRRGRRPGAPHPQRGVAGRPSRPG